MVSTTIDDVPNSFQFKKDGYQSVLLNKLDSLEIPIALFINEGLICRTNSISKNFELLQNWTPKEYVSLGNHSFKHARYSTTGFDSLSDGFIGRESISRQLAKKLKNPLQYFQFRFNHLR